MPNVHYQESIPKIHIIHVKITQLLSPYYKGSSTPIYVADVNEEGKWVTLKVKVVQIWDNTSDKITQIGLIGNDCKAFTALS